MGDEERERKRKGKQQVPPEMDDGDQWRDKRARTRSANMRHHWSGTTRGVFRDNRGENAPRPSAPVGNQPHGYRPMGQQSGVAPRRRPRSRRNPRQFVVQQQHLEQQEQRGPSAPQQIQIPGSNPQWIDQPHGHPTGQQSGAVVLGESSSSRHGLQGQARCPACFSSAIYNNTCTSCARVEAFRSFLAGTIPEDWRCSACGFYPGRMADQPWPHVCRCAVCQFTPGGRVCPICIAALRGTPQPRHQQNLGFDLNITRSSSSNSPAIWNPRPGLLLGPRPPQLAHPESCWPLPLPPPVGAAAQAAQLSDALQPPPRVDVPVGYGPALEYVLCPACRRHPARKLLQPREHDCVCFACRDIDRIVCPVCSSG